MALAKRVTRFSGNLSVTATPQTLAGLIRAVAGFEEFPLTASFVRVLADSANTQNVLEGGSDVSTTVYARTTAANNAYEEYAVGMNGIKLDDIFLRSVSGTQVIHVVVRVD
jgi:hypothetical protein